MRRGLIRLSDALNRAAVWAAVAALLLMCALTLLQVLARYGLQQPPQWTEEAARYAMIWAGLLGASVSFHDRVDPAVFPAVSADRGRLGLARRLVREGCALGFALIVLVASPRFLAFQSERVGESTGINLAWVSAVTPICFALVVAHALARLAAGTQDASPPQG